MTRNIKAIGLAVLAILAMSAFAASAAQAAPEFEASETGETMGSGGAGETFSTEAGDVVCSSSTFVGNATSKKATTEKTHPTYSGCKAFGFLSATVNTEKCDYVFHPKTKISETEYTATVAVDCASSSESIKVVASTCSAEIKETGELNHVIFTNKTKEGKMDLTVDATVSSIPYTVTNDGFLCPFSGKGNKTDGEYTTTSPITYTGIGDITVVGS